MRYFLVLLTETGGASGHETHAVEHEQFIDAHIADNSILLGGGFAKPWGGTSAAYVLATEGLDQATAIARRDPLVRHGDVTLRVVEWRLVGINRGAIDPALWL